MDRPLSSLRGVGPKKAALFEKLGVMTPAELVRMLPRTYEDYSRETGVAMLEHGGLAAVHVRILTDAAAVRLPGGRSLVTCTAADGTGRLRLTWFNQPYRAGKVRAGEQYFACGQADRRRGLAMVNPALSKELPGIVPVYPLTQGLRQLDVRRAMARALELPLPEDALPEAFREKFGLCGLEFALRRAHFPEDEASLAQARRRLAFEDMLYFQLALAQLRGERHAKPGHAMESPGALETVLAAMGLSPTAAQRRVMGEVARDMGQAVPMNRLLQGDVGSGKTLVALYAMKIAVDSGFQAVLLAPTEVLARQHFDSVQQVFGGAALLLKGGLKPKEREKACAAIASGEAVAIVGTHALLEEDVAFARLGLVVADEQQRFGVEQRARMYAKGDAPHVLIMTATPIPRTLSLLFFGDLDHSLLDEMPPGRRPVRTRFVPEERREDMYRFLQERANKTGEQSYVVCPIIEAGDFPDLRSAQQVYKELVKLLPGAKIGLLHGRMAAGKKEETIDSFRTGELDILVATTVIEVGVDVKRATAMVVENADRFGLAQLHQLRGRVGRSDLPSYCFLLSAAPGEKARERLDILCQTNDGFVIAERDLDLRGPGEFLGMRQHGESELAALSLAQGLEALTQARDAARQLLEDDSMQPFREQLRREAARRYAQRRRSIAAN